MRRVTLSQTMVFKKRLKGFGKGGWDLIKFTKPEPPMNKSLKIGHSKKKVLKCLYIYPG